MRRSRTPARPAAIPRSAGFGAISASLPRRAARSVPAHCRRQTVCRSPVFTIANVSWTTPTSSGARADFRVARERELRLCDRSLQRPGVERTASTSNRPRGRRQPLIALRVDVLQLVFHFARRGVARAHALRLAHPDAALEVLERRARQLLLVASGRRTAPAQTTPRHGRRHCALAVAPSLRSRNSRPSPGRWLPIRSICNVERHDLLADLQRADRMHEQASAPPPPISRRLSSRCRCAGSSPLPVVARLQGLRQQRQHGDDRAAWCCASRRTSC